MGKKTRYGIQMFIAAIFVMLLTVFIFTNDFVMSEPEEPTTEEVGEGDLEDGTFTGSAEGFGGPLEVEVTVENGEITDVTVLEHSETEDVSDPALDEIPGAIVDENSTGVEVVSGATATSTAIKEAVNDALGGGSSDEDDTEANDDKEEDTEEEIVYQDGTYTGSAEGYGGPLEVEVTIEDGEIKEVEVTEHDETEDVSDPALDELPGEIVDKNSADVEVVTGASATSEAIIDAVDDALEEAKGIDLEDLAIDGPFEDGEYEGKGEGGFGPIEVEVTVEDGEISDIVITEHSETDEISDPAFEEVPEEIMEENSTDVDIVSGATLTSEGIIEAVHDALKDAQ